MSAPIFRVGKVKRTGRITAQSVQGHLARTLPTRNADAKRTPLNEWLVGGPDQSLAGSIDAVISRAGLDPTNLRKDATLANDVMLTVSPEWFRPGNPAARGTWDEDRLKLFRDEANAFLKGFGARVVTAVLHLDESTPHVQAVIVPIMRSKDGKDWRLSGKDLFNPDALRTLQQAWQDRMAPHGVGPRIAGSTARHNPVRRFYAALDGFTDEDPVPGLKLTQPPPRPLLEGQEAHGERVGKWKKGEEQRIKRTLAPVSAAAARGRLYDAERRSADQLRGIVQERSAVLDSTAADLAVTKEQVAALRNVPLNQVAAALGFTDAVAPRENAIDLVKRVADLDYHGAVAWLAQRFGPDVAVAAVRQAAVPDAEAAATAPAVFTKADRTKRQLVERQLDALAAPAYRITSMAVTDEGKKVAKNHGKAKVDGEAERTFTKVEVLEMIPRLAAENYAGRNIFLTPLDPYAHHLLVDDVKPDGLLELEARGYTPALVLETSPGNHQVMLKVPRTEAMPSDAANEAFKDLNRDVGDARITGLIHPMRLAGFENRKAKHLDETTGQYPFVKLAVAVNRACRKAIALVQDYARAARPNQTLSI